MDQNPYIQEVAHTLASTEAGSLAATVMFERFTSLPSAVQREAYAAALIGELLVARARGGVRGNAKPAGQS